MPAKGPEGKWNPGKGISVTLDLLPWLQARPSEALEAAIAAGEVQPEDFANHGLDVPAVLELASAS